MRRVADVIAVMEEIAPAVLAEPWDNVGLMFGGRSWPVEHVLLAVDPSPAVVAQAEALGSAMVITHHPLFFDPIRNLVEGDLAFPVVSVLTRAALSLYAAHTNLDKSPTHSTVRGLAEALSFDEVQLSGFGGLAELPECMEAGVLARHVINRLGAPLVTLVGVAETTSVQRVALLPGAGGDGLVAAQEAGADIIITGELKHHQAVHIGGRVPIIAAGHLETERPVLGLLQRHLQERLRGPDIRLAEESSPIWSIVRHDSGG